MNHRFVFVAVLIQAMTTSLTNGAPLTGLCSEDETVFFSCKTTKQRWIGICGTPPRAVQYRFGKQNRLELRFPEDATHGPGDLTYAHYSRFRTERLEIGFMSNGIDYAVFDYTEEGKYRAGVRVTNAAGEEKELACIGPIVSQLSKLKTIIRCDPDNALNGGKCL